MWWLSDTPGDGLRLARPRVTILLSKPLPSTPESCGTQRSRPKTNAPPPGVFRQPCPASQTPADRL